MDDDANTRPTPAVGMPAVVPLDGIALLAAIHEVRDEARAANSKTDERIGKLEAASEATTGTVQRLGNYVSEHAKQLSELSSAQLGVIKSAAVAAELAAQAMSKVHASEDATAKMVQSAMAIQKDAISAAVKSAVKEQTAPTTEAMGAIVNELGIEDRVELGREVKPGDTIPKPTLARLEQQNKSSRTVQAIAGCFIAIVEIYRLMGGHL